MIAVPLLLWIIVCAAFGGIASAAFAVVFLWIPPARSARILPHFISFATGALLGAALLALLPEAIEGAESLHEALLGCILGLCRRAGDHVCGAECDLLVSAHDLLIGGRLSALSARKQLAIVRWAALHRIACITPAAA